MADIPTPPRLFDVSDRSAAVANVDWPERVITVLACPYETPTEVMYRHEMWTETVERNAFVGNQYKNKIRVNREHDRSQTVGKVCGYYPDRPEGLVVDTYIARTPLGDETLALAAEGILDGSVGMRVHTSDQVLDPRSRTRRIRKAFLDHFAFTADPAYESAQVIGVRHATSEAAQMVRHPALDAYWADPIFKWAAERVEARADNPKPYGDVRYADPKNGKYPIDTEEHSRAALAYFSMPKNHAGYSADEIKTIMGRIKAACKRFGIQVAD